MESVDVILFSRSSGFRVRRVLAQLLQGVQDRRSVVQLRELNKVLSHHHPTIIIISRVIEAHKEYLDRKELNFMRRDPKS